MNDRDLKEPGQDDMRPLTKGDVLPHVEPPGVAFLVQLFLIPLLIVSMIVAVWLLFSWLAHAGSDPRAVLKEIESGRGIRWQRAMTLASMLDHDNSRYDELRRDEEFGRQLGELLARQIKDPPGEGKRRGDDLELRYYLCRAAGQLETTLAVPALLQAASLERSPAEIPIRLGALESLTVLGNRLGSEKLLADPKVMEVLLECSRASDENDSVDKDKPPGYRPHGEVRTVAAYALGVLRDKAALDRLEEMLLDGYPSARFNAATGLARAGDARSVPVLLEMLDPAGEGVASDERRRADQDIRRRNVLLNGIKGAGQLCLRSPPGEHAELRAAIEKLVSDPLEHIADKDSRRAIERQANKVLLEINKRNKLDAASKESKTSAAN